jgi:ketosteroid isomerase-like protein
VKAPATLFLLLVLTSTPSCYVAVDAPPPAMPPTTLPAGPAETCAVWDREVAFARSVETHDAAAFAEHVHRGAVFVDSEGIAQGRDAIVKGWASIVRGDALHLGWHPTSVVVTGDPRVALSRGPYWLEIAKPGEAPRFMTGTYQSVWVKDADGAWRVLVDGGTPPPKESTPEAIAQLKASMPAACPTTVTPGR